MLVSTLFKSLLFSTLLPLTVVTSPVELGARTFELNTTVRRPKRSFDNARLTWYDISVGITSCGTTYSKSDFVVALNGGQFGSGYPGANCFREISISANGKSASAQIVDDCPGCPYGGLDLNEGLFEHFASPDVGVLTGSWDFV